MFGDVKEHQAKLRQNVEDHLPGRSTSRQRWGFNHIKKAGRGMQAGPSATSKKQAGEYKHVARGHSEAKTILSSPSPSDYIRVERIAKRF